MVGNDAIMSGFDKSLIVKDLRILRFFAGAFVLNLRRRYGALASPLRCNRTAVTVQSRRRYTVTATRLHRNGNGFWQKSRRRC